MDKFAQIWLLIHKEARDNNVQDVAGQESAAPLLFPPLDTPSQPSMDEEKPRV